LSRLVAFKSEGLFLKMHSFRKFAPFIRGTNLVASLKQQKPGGKQRSKYGERQSEAPMAERQEGVAVL
jgi:hypothetical protein